jgi:hypothetical protein
MFGARKKTRYINPPNTLKQKVGSGGLPVKIMEEAQKAIDENEVDFAPYAERFLDELARITQDLDKGDISDAEALEQLAHPVMQLKANGAVFHYKLISNIADIVLLLIDNIDDINADARRIIGVHKNAIAIIVESRLSGDGGAEGKALAGELQNACMRYYAKYKIIPE